MQVICCLESVGKVGKGLLVRAVWALHKRAFKDRGCACLQGDIVIPVKDQLAIELK